MKRNSQRHKKASAMVAYAFLIAAVVGTLIVAQVYVKRALQGDMQLASDQLAAQYGYGLNKGREHFHQRTSIFEVTAPGWGHPWTTTKTDGSFVSTTERNMLSLNHRWVPGRGD